MIETGLPVRFVWKVIPVRGGAFWLHFGFVTESGNYFSEVITRVSSWNNEHDLLDWLSDRLAIERENSK